MSRTRRPGEAVPSGTQVQTEATPQGPAPLPVSGTLRLRGEPLAESTGTATDEASSRRIRWSEDVVDNEGMGKKSSKVCCIYHKSHPVGESSSESESEDSSSSSDSDSDSDGGRPGAKRPERGRQKRDKKCDEHDHGPGHHKHKGKRRKPSPNAYERVPNYTKKHPEVQGT